MSKLLSPVLGTDTSSSFFTLYNSVDNKSLDVYFGLALLEVVEKRKGSFQYKHLLARLYNSGFKRKKLVETFKHPVSTLRRWGNVIKIGSIRDMEKAFSGQGAPSKITVEIANYIRKEFNRIYVINKYDYSKQIIENVKDIFGVQFTSESFRIIFNEEKVKMQVLNKVVIKENKGKVASESSLPLCNTNVEETEITDSKEAEILDSSINCNLKLDTDTSALNNTQTVSNTFDCSDQIGMNTMNNRKHSLSKDILPKPIEVHHLGLIIVLKLLEKIKFESKISYQWLSSIILGATNLEQSESLNFSSLENLLDQNCITSARHQHILLNMVATEENRFNVFIENAKLINLKEHSYFYYDPHSISYTGISNILKGWCGSSGKIEKVNYHDFIHSPNGEPVYFEIADNYLDMRERFIGVIDNFYEKVLDKPSKKPTFIVDRGIYGKEKMLEIDSADYGLVTWDKNYKKDAWDEKADKNNFLIQRARNYKSDLKTWNITFIKDSNWNKISGFYRLIVRIIPPKTESKNIEVPVLTNGKIDDTKAVYSILNRWLQENDFKYMIRHFGLNEITSYKTESYSSIEAKLVEKEVFSDEYKYYTKLYNLKKTELKEILLEKHNYEIQIKDKKEQEQFEKNEEIDKISSSLSEIKEQKKEITKKISKAEKFIKENKEILLSDKKAYLDAIKITARNIFYKRINEFKKFYDNNRKNHKILREIIRSNGKIIYKNNEIIYELNPARRFSKRQFKQISEFLLKISEEFNNENIGNLKKYIRLKKQK